mgnify:FL=1
MEEHRETEAVYSRNVLEMITLANEYCRFMEKAEDYTPDEILRYLQKISPLIYIKSALLPAVEPEDEDAVEHYVTEEEWENLFNILRNKFLADDEFHFVDIREKSHHDPVRASLAESFTDLYQDLKDFLLLYQNPRKAFKENAVAECRRLFESRYGYKLANSQAAIHCILYPEENPIGL